MTDAILEIHAVWDDEMGRWSATAPERPELHIEADTYEELETHLRRRLGDRPMRIQAIGFPGCGC